MSKHYRMALIGIGGMGELYAKAVGDVANATLVAGSCRTESKGRAFAEQFDCAWYGDYTQMLAEQKPDFAIISTPSGLHLDPALACAEAGVNVVCTKPLEITLARCDAMIEAAKEAGIVLAGLFPTRFTDVMRTVYDTAAEGRFGHLSTVNTYTPWWRNDAYYGPERWQGTKALDGGGAVINQSIHGIDAMQWLAGATMPGLPHAQNPVAEVFAYTAQRGHAPDLIEVEDTAVAICRFQNGALGQMLCCTSMYPGALKKIQIAGRDGLATVEEETLVHFHFRNERDSDDQTRARFADTDGHGGASDPLAISYENEAAQFRALLEAMDEGAPPPIDGVEARKAVAIVEAIYESASAGRAATVR